MGVSVFSSSPATSKRLLISYSHDATVKNNLIKTQMAAGHLSYRFNTTSLLHRRQEHKPHKCLKRGYETAQFLTIAVANLVSLSDFGFLCRCSISLSESNSPLRTQKSNRRLSNTKHHLARTPKCPPDLLSLTHLLGHCSPIHIHTGTFCSSSQANPHAWDNPYKILS